MNILAILSEHTINPVDYVDRSTVKAVIINEHDEVLLFSGALPGGGVEVGETTEHALARECMEEIGATVEIIRELGTVIAYRDVLQKKYIFYGYECRLQTLIVPTTVQHDEIGKMNAWEKRDDAILRMERYVDEVKIKGKEFFEGDRYQRHLFNTQAAILFLKEIGE